MFAGGQGDGPGPHCNNIERLIESSKREWLRWPRARTGDRQFRMLELEIDSNTSQDEPKGVPEQPEEIQKQFQKFPR